MAQNILDYAVQSWHSNVVETHEISGKTLEIPLIKAAVGVVIKNPFAGQEFREDLGTLTAPSRELGVQLGSRARKLLGGAEVEGYGKGGVAGTSGEQEHVVSCVTTVFGNGFRDAIGGGKAWISSFTKVSGAGTSIDIPLAYKDEVYVRSHYDGVTLHVDGSPKPDELLICVAVSSGPRPFARVGGMTKEEAAQKSGS